MNLVTIIIPMYNEEENIEKCISYLKEQTNQKFDVIFVDDGSVDNTKEKLKELLKKGIEFNSNLLTQTNQGAAAARKNGINYAKTDFVMILDCDDKLSNDFIDELYKVYDNNNNVDIMMPQMTIQDENKNWSDLVFYTDNVNLNSFDCVFNSLNGWHVHGCFAIKKRVIEKSYSDYEIYNKNNENYINNDEVITRLNFLNSDEIIKFKSYYHYCYNENSTTNKINNKKYLMINNAFILYQLFSENKKIERKSQEELIAVLWGTFRYMKKNEKELNNLKDWVFILNEKISGINYFQFMASVSLKKKIQLTLLKLAYLF